MSVTDELLRNADRYAAEFDKGHLPMPPAKHVAVVACMDARLTRSACSASRRATRTSSATLAAW
jgi:carbonic anhydrase